MSVALQLAKFLVLPTIVGSVVTPVVLSSNLSVPSAKIVNKKEECYLVFKDNTGKYSLLYCSSDIVFGDGNYKLYDNENKSKVDISNITNSGAGKFLITLAGTTKGEVTFETSEKNIPKEIKLQDECEVYKGSGLNDFNLICISRTGNGDLESPPTISLREFKEQGLTL